LDAPKNGRLRTNYPSHELPEHRPDASRTPSANAMSTFACPYCRETFTASAGASPTPVHCPHCHQLFEIANQAPPPVPPAPAAPPVKPHASAKAGHGFECPFCHTQSPPYRKSQVSTAGWVTLIALLITCFPLFWIGLFMKEDVHVCRSCGIKLGG